jgi:HEAT repeat protein
MTRSTQWRATEAFTAIVSSRKTMHKSRGKLASLVALSLALLVTAAAGFAMRERIAERWYIWQLGSQDGEVRAAAALKLAGMRSVRAIPRLIGVFRQEAGGPLPVQFCTFALAVIGEPAVPALLEELKSDNAYVRGDAAMVLGMIGVRTEVRGLLEALQQASSDRDSYVRDRAQRWVTAILDGSTTVQFEEAGITIRIGEEE